MHTASRPTAKRRGKDGKSIAPGDALKVVVFNTLFYAAFFVFSIVAIPTLTLLGVLVRCVRSHRMTMAFFRRAIGYYGKVVVKILPYPFVKIAFRDDEPERNLHPYIGVCNHQSASDPFVLACLKGEFVQVVNIWPFRLPVLGPYARWAGYLSVNEMEPNDFLHAVSRLLKSGVSILGFPEGTRSRTGNMGPFHSIMFRAALQNRCPIIPISILGNQRTPAPGSGVLHPARIIVHKLPALTWETYRDMTPFQLKNVVRDRLMQDRATFEAEA